MNFRVVLLISAFALPAAPDGALGQGSSEATIQGRVTSRESGKPLAGISVALEGLRRSVLTDSLGWYRLSRAPPGPQVLTLQAVGYATVRDPVVVPASGVLVRHVAMAVQALKVEGITVTADPIGRARGELGTASVIGSEAIRYQSATSLSGILELVPGMSISPPGLEGVQQVSLRAVPTSGVSGGRSASDLASFGTLIVLDGIPQSNNANLQTLGVTGESSFASSVGGGIDLRAIPAATIERVEVIRGIPSVRYGDLTQGAVIVDTRAGAVDPLLSGKLDARSAAVNLIAGDRVDWLGGTATVAFDLTSTQSAPGLSEDRSYRFAGQLAHRLEREWKDGGRLTVDTRVDIHRLNDDRPENPNTRLFSSSESSDLGFRVSERALMQWDNMTLSFTGSLGTVVQRVVHRAQRSRNGLPFTERTEEGRAIGRFIVGDYTSELTLDGRPWMAYTRFEGAADHEALGFDHKLRAGLELRREWNAGSGYQFDMAFPPQTNLNGVNGFDRPRRFDDIPAMVTTSLYVDDSLRRTLGQEMVLSAQAGVRLDLLHDGSTWASGARSALLQPRINVDFQPRPWLRIRGGWGLTAKMPGLTDLYPGRQYYDLVNVNWFTADSVERLAVLTTFVIDRSNPELGMARGEKAEVGVELGLGRATIAIVAFRERIRGGFGMQREPSLLLRDHYELADSTVGTGQPTEIIEPPTGADTIPIFLNRPHNNTEIVSRGFELTALFPEITLLRTRLHVQGAWVRTQRFTDVRHFGPPSEVTDFQLRTVRDRIPYWEALEENGWRALATYRLIHHQPEAGLVISLNVQHNIIDRFRDVGGTDTLAFAGYLSRGGRLVPVTEENRTDPEYSDLREPRSGSLAQSLSTPADWLLSAQVSKTLPLGTTLSFWAFNVLDRAGIYGDLETRGRLYPQMRFGLELTARVRSLAPW